MTSQIRYPDVDNLLFYHSCISDNIVLDLLEWHLGEKY